MIYTSPALTTEDRQILEEIYDLRLGLEAALRPPRRWQGVLRRNMLARAIRGSNSIEGYNVEADEAAAALNDEEPLTADEETFAEIRGYRLALGYVLASASDPAFTFDTTVTRAMHYMMLQHDLSKSPGKYRTGPVYVRDDKSERNVYEGAPAEEVPVLMEEFAASLRAGSDLDPLVRGAMAHLNLVMVHPFRDGNGRMARALQTLVIARAQITDPAFCGIEEWLGNNTEDYYRVLALTGNGSWQPRPDAQLWMSFNLRAHHMQAQTLDRRLREAAALWTDLDNMVATNKLPERVTELMFDALLGYRVRRSSYIKVSQIDNRTATRDLSRLTTLGILDAHGETRGRFYTAGPVLRELRERRKQGRPIIRDPYPWMREALLRTSPPMTASTSSRSAPGSG